MLFLLTETPSLNETLSCIAKAWLFSTGSSSSSKMDKRQPHFLKPHSQTLYSSYDRIKNRYNHLKELQTWPENSMQTSTTALTSKATLLQKQLKAQLCCFIMATSHTIPNLPSTQPWFWTKKGFKAAKRIVKLKGCAFLIAQDFYKIKLCGLAVAIIIGCGSGVTAIFNTDDVLGIPSALFYSSTSAAVSTLWPIDDEGDAEFSQHLFAEIWR